MAATTATAGIIVGVVTLTGLGLKLAGVIVDAGRRHAGADGRLFRASRSGCSVWRCRSRRPTSSRRSWSRRRWCRSGVPDFAAHMFIFYYAVLSEVSPPTALSPFAAAALTGGNPFKTMMLTWKYTLPAFVVPFVFTLRPEGAGILLRGPVANVGPVDGHRGPGHRRAGRGLRRAGSGPVSPSERALLVMPGCLLSIWRARGVVIGERSLWRWCSSCNLLRHGTARSRRTR